MEVAEERTALDRAAAAERALARPSGFSGSFRSNDVDEARAAATSVFCPHQLDVRGRADSFDSALATWEFDTFAIVRLRHGAEVVISHEPLGAYYVVQMHRTGWATVRQGRQTMECVPGGGTIVSPTPTLELHWSDDYELLSIRIDREAVERQLARILGHDLDAPVVFDVAFDFSTSGGRAWLATFRRVVDEIRNGSGSLGHSLVRGQAEQLLIERLLLGQHHSFSEQLVTGYPAARPPAVRHAIEIIHARAGEPLTIPLLAELVGVGVRHLQKGFDKHLGTTPLHYLREVRLERAHEELLAGCTDDTSVNTVAYRWGFAHMPRFAGYYKRRYRELPSETLQRRA